MTDETTDSPVKTSRTRRPHGAEGTLLAAGVAALTPPAALERVLEAVTDHVERVCSWPRSGQGSSWTIGDYSFYVLQFAAVEGALLYAQLWSEPDEGVLFEVSSGAWNPPAGEYISAAQREALLNRGFETGGRAGNYRKVIQLERAVGCRTLARELIGVLTECLGYDGRAALDYKLHLGRRTRTAQVFGTLTYDDFGRLLKSWGLAIEPLDSADRTAWRITGEYPFIARLMGETKEGSGEYEGFKLSVFATLSPAVRISVERDLQQRLPFSRVYIDEDEDVVVSQLVFLGLGVTEAHMRQLMQFWRQALVQVAEAVLRHKSAVDEHELN